MEQFSLEKYLENLSRKVVTREGRPVRIVCWDRNTTYWKIIGLVTSPDGSTENPFTYDVDGIESDGYLHDHRNDLFFADEEEELTELQKTLEEDCDCYINLYNDGKTREELREWIKCWCHRIIDLARKEIEKENSEFKPIFTYNEKDYSKLANKLIEFRNNTPLCSVSYRDGEGRKVILHYEKEITDLIKKEVLESLPKWKKITKREQNYLVYGYLSNDEYYLSIKELIENLPKEK